MKNHMWTWTTEAAINEMQTYYEVPIRKNVTSRQEVRESVWPDYFHLPSSSVKPSNSLCVSTYHFTMNIGDVYSVKFGSY